MSGTETTGSEFLAINGGLTMSESTKAYKREAITAARELMYSNEIIKRLNTATTESEICRLMIEGRHEKQYY